MCHSAGKGVGPTDLVKYSLKITIKREKDTGPTDSVNDS
jgi:hypothetical protein